MQQKHYLFSFVTGCNEWMINVLILVVKMFAFKVKQQKCQADDFECGGGVCLERRRVCDGTWDCSNGQDEKKCSK